MNKSYKFGCTTTVDEETMDKLLCKGSEPQTTEITMQVSDIKTIKHEDLQTSHEREEYGRLLLKIYWYLQGLTDLGDKLHQGAEQLLEEMEHFI